MASFVILFNFLGTKDLKNAINNFARKENLNSNKVYGTHRKNATQTISQFSASSAIFCYSYREFHSVSLIVKQTIPFCLIPLNYKEKYRKRLSFVLEGKIQMKYL